MVTPSSSATSLASSTPPEVTELWHPLMNTPNAAKLATNAQKHASAARVAPWGLNDRIFMMLTFLTSFTTLRFPDHSGQIQVTPQGGRCIYPLETMLKHSHDTPELSTTLEES